VETVVAGTGFRLTCRLNADFNLGEGRFQVLDRTVGGSAVDVLIAAWNRSDTIERAILSVLGEPDVQCVIVVDDGSTDDTAARARQCDDDNGRVVVRRLPSNCGPSHARNFALKISTAPWVTVLDGDDFVLPGRIRALLSIADDWDFVADDLLQIEADRVDKDKPRPVLFDPSFAPWRLDLETFALGNIPQRGRLRKEMGFLKPLMRREFLGRHALHYDEMLRLGEDYALYARALALGARFLIVPSQGYVSVVRTDSISAHHTKQDLERLRDSDLDLCTLEVLTEKERRAVKKHHSSVDARVQWLAMIEAFKSRSPRRFLAPLFRSPQISLFLVRKLLSEFSRRIQGRLGYQRGCASN
jgi:succinoglycan biosynthesis protein ExoU